MDGGQFVAAGDIVGPDINLSLIPYTCMPELMARLVCRNAWKDLVLLSKMASWGHIRFQYFGICLPTG